MTDDLELSMKLRRQVAAILQAELIRRGLLRAEYARMLGHHRKFVTEVLSCRQNLTLKTVAILFNTLGLDPEIIRRKSSE